MVVKFLSRLIPSWIRSSIALKVLLFVGMAIICLVALQTYININQMEKKLTPLVSQELQNALVNSEHIFSIVAKQTREDAQIIGSHNALSNYIDYEELNDPVGMNEEIVNIEQFLRSLTNFKTQYQDIEIIIPSGSIIRLVNGEVTQASHLFQQLFTGNSEHLRGPNSESKRQAFFSQNNQQISYTLIEHFKGDNTVLNGLSSEFFIKITHNVSNEVSSLINVLNDDQILLSAHSKQQLILKTTKTINDHSQWIESSLTDENINLTLTVFKEKKHAFLLIDEMKNSSFLLAIGSILVISISLFLTSKYVIATPLKNIIAFINHDVLKQSNLKSRYESRHIDEIGVFSHGLNNMLDRIQNRETALKNSEERLALALWGGGEGMWELDFTSRIIYLDSGSSVILQLGELSISKSIENFFLMIHPDDTIRVRKYIDKFYGAIDELFEIEFRLFTNKDHYLWLQLKGKLNQQSHKSNTHGITGTLRDITEEIKAEQEIQLYATAFNSSNNAIAILDTHFYVIAINKAFSRITGFTSEEAAGELPSFIEENANSFNVENIDLQIDAHGYWSGELIGKRKNNDVYVKDVDLNPVYGKDKLLTHYVCVFSDITEKKKSEKELWKLANYDILTKLPNRGYFRKKVKTAITESSHPNALIALLFIDLDKFKQVNDTLGHESGDELLKKVAKILKRTIRNNDTVARLGGDEFAILLENISQKHNAEVIAEKIITEFTNGISVQQNATGVGASIGISFYPLDADNAQSLVHCADTAMYSAKTSGSNLYHVYNSKMGDHVNRRNQIESELTIALKENSLCLYYQPQLDLKTGKVVGFEALSRWFHPLLGFISPDEFIPIAEETGLIAKLGLNVFNQACKQLKVWHELGYSELRMAINISPKQFLLTDIHIDIANTIKQCGIDAKYLELELTESLIVEDPEKITDMLHTLKSIGLRLSIDDFGTGYSSLSYLSKFPLDILKIDKSFVQNSQNDRRGLALTKSIIGIAKSLNLEVIAEGIETKDQLNTLTALGCHYMQGYYYSRAVSADDACLLLEKDLTLNDIQKTDLD